MVRGAENIYGKHVLVFNRILDFSGGAYWSTIQLCDPINTQTVRYVPGIVIYKVPLRDVRGGVAQELTKKRAPNI